MRFLDAYLPDGIESFPVDVAPMFSTQLVTVDSGAEQANQRWLDPLREISIPQGVRDTASFVALQKQWLVCGGPARTFPWTDPFDFASVDIQCEGGREPAISAEDQALGVGDGLERAFQLTKLYEVGGETYTRNIHFPREGYVLVAVNGVVVDPADYVVSRPGGIVTFDTAPADGAVLTAGFYFDLQVRFVDDQSFSAIMRAYRLQGFSDIPLREIPYCPD